ncbi:MAG: GDSL-type esterase/lipase family protein [Mariniblastus sp.]|nr:GDSL-type esterase/lipase family protein [Mariniblastus sp.]
MKLTCFFLALFVVTCWSLTAPAEDGDRAERLIFLGDSITQAGAGPQGYISHFRRAIEADHPDLDIEVIGAGISGNKVPDLQRRLQRDVLDKEPSIVVIYIGINDVWHSQNGRGTSKQDFRAGLKDIIGKIQSVGGRVVICTPSVIGEKTDGSNSLDGMLDEYADISRQVAGQTGCQLIDLRKAFLEHLKVANQDNAERSILTTDGVHLNAAGNQFVADQMQKGLNLGSTGRKLRHVVMFRFTDQVTPAGAQEIVAEFGKLPEKIEQISGYEFGTSIGDEKMAQQFTHCFVVTFDSQQDLDAYLPHPAHQAFVQFLDGKIEKLLVFDYWTD